VVYCYICPGVKIFFLKGSQNYSIFKNKEEKMVVNISAKDGFIWHDSYKLGDDHVDAQHRQLFELVNSIIRSCNIGDDTEKLKAALDFLVIYAVQHFNDEEELQIKCNYPEYERHKKRHDDFKITVTDLVKRFEQTGSSTELGDDIKKIVLRWLLDHILYEDKKISEYL